MRHIARGILNAQTNCDQMIELGFALELESDASRDTEAAALHVHVIILYNLTRVYVRSVHVIELKLPPRGLRFVLRIKTSKSPKL
jgi:hypothetical protein